MRRTPEVIDAWFDSGAMPYAQWHYPFEHEAEFTAHFPADFICEGVDQTRGWFYSLLAIATAAFDATAYRHVIVNELVLDREGQKMSKTRGNVVSPWDMVKEFGADTVRVYLLASSQVWLPKRFDRNTIPEVAGGFFNTLRNSYNFFANLRRRRFRATVPVAQRPLSDRWLLSRLDATIESVNAAWAATIRPPAFARSWTSWITTCRTGTSGSTSARFWAPDGDAEPAAAATLHEALVTVARLLAPAAPFASDWLHRALTGTSVHLARFPVVRGVSGSRARGGDGRGAPLATLARAARDDARLRVRQPLRRMQVAVPPAAGNGALAGVAGAAARGGERQGRSRSSRRDAELVRLRAKAELPLPGQSASASARPTWPPRQPASRRNSSARWKPGSRRRCSSTASAGHVRARGPGDRARGHQPSGWCRAAVPSSSRSIPQLDDALRREGFAREVVSRIQRLRKDAGVRVHHAHRSSGSTATAARSTPSARTRTFDPARDPRSAAGDRAAGAGARHAAAARDRWQAVVVGVRRSDEPGHGGGTLTTEVA